MSLHKRFNDAISINLATCLCVNCPQILLDKPSSANFPQLDRGVLAA